MPQYLFSNPKDETEIVELFMGMNDSHEYVVDGVKWDRVWTRPAAQIDGFDAFDSDTFVRKTGNYKGSNFGELQDASAELSQKRIDKLGYDPVKQKTYDDYKKRNKKEHPASIKERLSKPVKIKF